MTNMQRDKRVAGRVQAAEDRMRPRANPEDEQDAVRPRAAQQDAVETNQSSAEPIGDRNRYQSGSGEMQVVGHAVPAFAQCVK